MNGLLRRDHRDAFTPQRARRTLLWKAVVLHSNDKNLCKSYYNVIFSNVSSPEIFTVLTGSHIQMTSADGSSKRFKASLIPLIIPHCTGSSLMFTQCRVATDVEHSKAKKHICIFNTTIWHILELCVTTQEEFPAEQWKLFWSLFIALAESHRIQSKQTFHYETEFCVECKWLIIIMKRLMVPLSWTVSDSVRYTWNKFSLFHLPLKTAN